MVKYMYMLMISVLLLAGFLLGSASAQEEKWEFGFTPYIWGAGLKGDTTVGRTETEIDLSFSDILEDLKMALMGDFRAEKGRWAIQTNFVWTDLKSDAQKGPLDITVEPQTIFWELAGHYRVAPTWELLAGLRYYYSEIDIDIDTPITQRSVSGDESWIDPIIGAAFRAPLNARWSFAARGDIGGFGAGPDFAWGALAVFDYQLGETTSITFGYRHLDFDYETGSGNREFGMDAYLTGPVIGASFRF
jgi:hypothetical protein